MNFISNIRTSVEEFLNQFFAILTSFFQSINLDENLEFLCTYNLLVCSIIFIALLVYFIFFDKTKSYYEFAEPMNIVVLLICIPIYSTLSEKSVSLEFLGLGSIPIHSFILIVLAKYYGPLITAAFAGFEYILTYISTPDNFMFSVLFIYSIGGLIHGWLLYEKKASFWRCLLARFLTILLCNIMLLSFVRAGEYSHNSMLSYFIPNSIVSGLIQLPLQAVLGYFALLAVKFVRVKLELTRGEYE